MYSSIVDFIISNYKVISVTVTFIAFVSFLYIGYRKKGLNFTDNKWELSDLIAMLTGSYTIYTGTVIMFCAGQIDKLKSIQLMWLYLIIAGGALVYTSIYGILKNIDSK